MSFVPGYRLAHCKNTGVLGFTPLLTSSLLLLLLLWEFHLQVFAMNTSWWALFKHLDAEMSFSILPSQIGSSAERASRFLSNKTVNKDILGLLSCIHLREHKPTCWFMQTQLQPGQRVSFPCYLSPVVSYFWQSGTQGRTRCLQSLQWLRPFIYSPLSTPNREEILLQKSRFSAMKWEKQHLRLD